MDSKTVKLNEIAKEIERCDVCKKDKSGKAVPGEGNPDAEIVFVGEAPGRQEAKIGRPFVGRSGKFLRSSIKDIGLEEEDVFITSPVKYLPDRGTPTKFHTEHGRLHLIKQLDVIKPKIIVLLGKVACLAILEEEIPINKRHGDTVERDGKKYFISFHPSAAIRFQKFKKPFVEDFKKIKSLL